MITVGSFFRGEAAGLEADHSPPIVSQSRKRDYIYIYIYVYIYIYIYISTHILLHGVLFN
jgi:hypothetical protein